MGKASRDKGARGEREWRNVLRSLFRCDTAERGCQRAGGPHSPDVINGIPGTHAEVKRVERLRLYEAMEQASGDAGDSIPYVASKRNRGEWLITVRAEDMPRFAELVYLQLISNPYTELINDLP